MSTRGGDDGAGMRGGATARDVLGLAEEIQSAVRLRFGIELEREPVLLGFQG